MGRDAGRILGHQARWILLPIGTAAPDFELPNQHRQPIRLSSFHGQKNVVLAFHPLAFTPVCSAQMQTYERERRHLDALDACVLAISLDANPSKKAWADALGGISYGMLSDCHPHGRVAAASGVLGDNGLADRAILVVDKTGIIRWTKHHEMSDEPDVQELLQALAAL